MGLLARLRRYRLPADARREFERTEHVVGWAPLADGHLIATNRGLWAPGRDRLGWHQIHKANWSGRELVVTPAELLREEGTAPDAPADVYGDGEPLRYPIDDPGELPYQVRVRVTRSVAYSTHHDLPNGGVRIFARRVPGRDGLAWALRYDDGTAMIGADHDLVADLVTQARAAAETA